ncbi:MAG TPA: helix-turn-helix domain-containing protein [Streptosporangiaceae bacterium]|nr:helix-turn-helix domain-containing protein [Streptosporangiaceae bacterium]
MSEVALAGRLLLTPVEAAIALGLSRTRIYELMASGELSSVKIGRSRRISVTALYEFIALASDSAA